MVDYKLEKNGGGAQVNKPRQRNHGPRKMLDLGIKIRIAADADGPAIGQLAWDNGFQLEGVTWDRVYPYWLMAELHGELIGAVQISHGIPVARVETLCLSEKLTQRERAVCVRQILVAAMVTLRSTGAQAFTSLVPFKLKSYKRAIKNRGGKVMDSGNIMIFPLYGGEVV